VLLHEHDNAMEDNEDRMSPWPASMNCPADNRSKIESLPYLPSSVSQMLIGYP